MKRKIFISYRRSDSSGFAGRIYDRLKEKFGNESIFMDVTGIDAGLDFVKVLEDSLDQSDVLIALIGREWLNIKADSGGRRIDNPKDYVRIEIGTALARGIRVIPVTLERAKIPKAVDLPDDLKELSHRNSIGIEHATFDEDVLRLINGIEKALSDASQKRSTAEGTAGNKLQFSSLIRNRYVQVVGLAILVGVLYFGNFFGNSRSSGNEISETSTTPSDPEGTEIDAVPTDTEPTSPTPENMAAGAGAEIASGSPLDNLTIDSEFWTEYFIQDQDSYYDQLFFFPFDNFFLELPATIDPSVDPDKALAQIASQLTAFGVADVPWPHVVNWVTFDISLSNVSDPNSFPISIDNVAKVRITSFTPREDHVNVIDTKQVFIPVTGGGGGMNFFSPLSLDPENWEVQVFSSKFLDSEFIKLNPQDFQYLQFPIHCSSPGIYSLSIEIFVSALGDTKTLTSESSTQLNCPKSITVWRLGEGYKDIERIGTFNLVGWEYLPEEN